MEFVCRFLYQLKHKKWYQTKFFILLLILFGLYLIIFGMLFLFRYAICFRYDGLEKISLFLAVVIMIILLIPIGIVFCLTVKEKNIYNKIIDSGKVLEGNINGFHNAIYGFRYDVSVEDTATGKRYCYYQVCDTFQNRELALAYMKEEKKIYVLVDESNYKRGIILYDEYFYRQGKKDNSKRKKRWDGSYQINILPSKDVALDSNEILVEGKMLKESLDVYLQRSVSALYVLTVDIAYFNQENSKVHIFKGKTSVTPALYFNLLQHKEEIKVKVKYDKTDESKYTVFLDEALEKL